MKSITAGNRTDATSAASGTGMPALRAAGDPSALGGENVKVDTGSLQRGLAILDAIIKAERPVTSGEIAVIVGLSPSTTHRLLRSLSDQGYLFRDGAKRYYPSVRALFPPNLFHPLNVLRRVSIEQLIGLRERFSLASSFLIFLGGKRWVLETVHGHDALSPYSDMEVAAPLHATVAGKILLSTMTDAEREELLGPEPYEKLTASTITNREKLSAELAQVTEQSYATAFDEMLQGLSAVGAPVWCAPKRPLGAIVLAGPSQRLESAKLEEAIAAVVEAAGLLTFASPDVRAACRLLGS